MMMMMMMKMCIEDKKTRKSLQLFDYRTENSLQTFRIRVLMAVHQAWS